MGVSTRLLARQSDTRLLELLSQGHEPAFEAIVLRYRPELLTYCRRLGLSDGRAEDALQHALLKAWLALQGGTEVRELRAWLYRIVHNTAVNVMRSSPEERAMDLDAALIEAAAVQESELERTTAAREALTHVAALPPMQRHAMLLSAVEGCTHEEVASALGITHVAVRGLLYRARVTLRAAAAALTPAPLIGWVSQATDRLAGSAGGLAQLSAGGGGSDLGGVLLKGGAVAATTALAAGAVLGPLHGHHAQPRSSATAGRTLASASDPASAASAATQQAAGPHNSVSSPVRIGARPQAGTGKAGAGAVLAPLLKVPAGSRMRRIPLWSLTPRSSSGTERASPGPSVGGTPVVVDSAGQGGGVASAGGGGGSVVESGGGAKGSGSEGVPTSPEAGGGSGGEPKGEDGGAGQKEAEAASEKSEHEAELAREQSEHEAEAAREQSEREAEARREAAEASR
jgi:RNA polymerase sigma factor (sigma-70 family)